MKILWLCGNPGLFHAKALADGGWIGALQTQLLHENAYIQLVNVFEYPQKLDREQDGRVTYYPIYRDKKTRWKSLLNEDCYDQTFLARVKEIIRDEQPDMIHCWGSELGYGLIAKETPLPVVMHIQGLLTPYVDAFFPPGYNMISILQTMALHPLAYLRHQWRPYRIFLHNAQREKEIMRNIPYVLGRTKWDKDCANILAPQATYLFCSEALRPSLMECEKWQWHEGRHHLIISSVMSVSIYKGTDVILRTAKILKQTYGDDFEWNIYGVDDLSLHEWHTGIKAADVNVYACGRIAAQDLSERLRNSDVYCHLAYIENSSNSICEAQYIGVPVVAAMMGGTDTLLKDGAGVLVPTNDAYRTACEILRLNGNKDFAESVSAKEIEVAVPRHDHVATRLINIYKTILNEEKDRQRQKI